MIQSTRYEKYLICQERGHEPGGIVLDSIPPWDTCKYCGTAFLSLLRFHAVANEVVVYEMNAPEKDNA